MGKYILDSEHPLVSVLLPNWNTRDDSLEFLESLARQTYPKSAIELIISDNDSSDGSQEAFRQWFAAHSSEPWHRLELVELTGNQGIAVGYNAAYKHSSPQSFAILRAESDVIWKPDLMALLVADLLELPDAGVIGAKGVIGSAARYINWWTGRLYEMDPDIMLDCDCVFGGTFIARRSCIERLGYFFRSEHFLASELEFCTRVKRLGYRVLYDPHVVVQHKGARSTANLDGSKFAYVCYRELVLFHLAYNHFPQKAVFLAHAVAYCLKQALLANGMHLRAFHDGLILGSLHRSVHLPGTPPGTQVSVADWLAQPRLQ